LLSIVAALSGCYLSHRRGAHSGTSDGSIEAAIDATSDGGVDAPDGADSSMPCPRCGPPRIVGETRFPSPGDDFPWALLGVVRVEGALGVLVAVNAFDDAADRYVEYRLLLIGDGGATSWAEPAALLKSREKMVAGAVDVYDGAIRAVVLGTDYSGPVEIRSATWSADGTLRLEQHLGTLPAPEVSCHCTRTGGLVLLGTSSGIAAVADGDVLHVADLDLGSGMVSAVRTEPLPTTSASDATSVSGAIVEDHVLMAVGGSWPTLVPRPAAVATGPTPGPWLARLLPGSDTDPAPIVASDRAGFRVARFIHDIDDSSRSTIHLWQLDAAGISIAEVTFATGGFQPLALTMTAETPSSALLWVDHDPADLGAGNLRLARFDASISGGDCSSTATLAHLPNGVLGLDPRSLVALRHEDAVVAVFIERDRASSRITALELPDCLR